MRNINFVEVGMENYGPYIDRMVLKFEPDQLTLITGPNGVGKTMALDAIPFTLFGMTSKGLKGDDVVNNISNKNCYTWVEFHVDGDQYIAKRYQKYHKFGGNNLVLSKNGVDIKSGAREVQPEIERLICPSKGFMNTLMFGQKVKDFFTDLTDSKQKEIFRKLLGLDNYLDYYKETDNRIKDMKQRLESSERQIEVKKELISDSKERIKELQESKRQFEIQKEEILSQLQKSKRDAERLLKENEVEKSKLEKLSKDSTIIRTKLDELRNESYKIDSNMKTETISIVNQGNIKRSELKEEANSRKNEVNLEYEKVKDKINEDYRKKEKEIDLNILNLREDVSKIENEIGNINNKCQYIKQNISKIIASVVDAEISTCPVCHQKITEHTIADLKKEINDGENEINESLEKIENLRAILNSKTNEINILNNEKIKVINKLKEEINSLENEKNKKIQELDNRLSEVLIIVNESIDSETKNIQIKYQSQSKEISEKILELQKEMDNQIEIESEIKKVDDAIQSCKNSISTIEIRYSDQQNKEYDEAPIIGYFSRIKDHEKVIETLSSEISEDQRTLEILEFWKIAYSPSGIPAMLIDEAIPFMNRKVSEYLEELSNGRYIVSFDTQGTIKSGEIRDKISVNVLDTYTRANQRLQLSGGQTRLVDIATILTLGDLQANNLGIQVNLLIFDEIFDSLDSQNIDYVSKVLTRIKKGRSVYLISHTHQDQLEADNILEIRS